MITSAMSYIQITPANPLASTGQSEFGALRKAYGGVCVLQAC